MQPPGRDLSLHHPGLCDRQDVLHIEKVILRVQISSSGFTKSTVGSESSLRNGSIPNSIPLRILWRRTRVS